MNITKWFCRWGHSFFKYISNYAVHKFHPCEYDERQQLYLTLYKVDQCWDKAMCSFIQLHTKAYKSCVWVYVLLHHKVISWYMIMNSCSISKSFLYNCSTQPLAALPCSYRYIGWSCSVMVCFFIHNEYQCIGKQQFRLH